MPQLPTSTGVARLPVSPKPNHRRVGPHWCHMLAALSMMYWLYFDLGAFWVRNSLWMCSRSRLKRFQQCLEAMQKRLQTLKVCSSTNLQQCNVVWMQDTVETDMTLQGPETKTDSQAKAIGCDDVTHQNQNKIFFCDDFNFNWFHHSTRSKSFDSLPGSTASHFSTSESTDSFRSQNTCSCSHGKSCISSIRSEGTAMCSAPV